MLLIAQRISLSVDDLINFLILGEKIFKSSNAEDKMENKNKTLDSNINSSFNFENISEKTAIREPKRYKVRSKTDFISANQSQQQDEEKKTNSTNSNNSDNDNNEFTTVGMSIQERF